MPKHTISQKSTWASHEPTPQIADTIMDMIKQRRKNNKKQKTLVAPYILSEPLKL
jgi:hypothetical protein